MNWKKILVEVLRLLAAILAGAGGSEVMTML